MRYGVILALVSKSMILDFSLPRILVEQAF